LEMALESLSKGNYPHFMLKEIYEQVQSVVNTMRGRINFANGHVQMGGFLVKSHRNALLSARRIMFIACGTSLNACIAVRPLFDELAGCPTAIENASDFLDRSPKIFRDDVCFFVSQSGETADVLRALEYCRDAGAVLVGMTNTVGSSISRLTHFGAHLNCGPEIGVASTKAFSSQIVALTLISLMLAEDSVSLQPRRTAILKGLENLSADIDKALRMTEEKIKKVAASFVSARSLLIIGRGFQYATCLEAALKVKELSYIHTEGINAGELKHGPLALIDETIPVIVICTKDHLVDRSRAAVQQIRARNGKPIVILSDPDPEVEALAEEVIRVPSTVDCLQVLINAIPMQLLAYHVAVMRGNDVDCPRNLAKSVTVQ
jgi:glutamine---fructose-6-phosphate transaminase (isomerizing)